MTFKTTLPKISRIEREWWLVDAKDRVLGRLASRIARVLRGKHKATYTPFLDTGDFVIVVNAKQIKITGRRLTQKMLQSYSGYPGGRRLRPLLEVMARHPERILRQAVKGMLPEGPLGRHMLTKLKVYAGPEHVHAAQKPKPASTALLGAKS